MHPQRRFICAANWKMNKGPDETKVFFENFLPLVAEQRSEQLEIVVFPPAINITTTKVMCEGTKIFWGAQNCYSKENGAFTGETSPDVIKKLGAKYMLIGHSERRTIFRETDEELNAKMKIAQKLNLLPMLCIGEVLAEREAGRTLEIVEAQLSQDLKELDFSKPMAIAYEPVWAIGTGKVATPKQVEETHAQIRNLLATIGGMEFAEKTPILYGGSVKPDNAHGLAKIADVDGFLVGGASLEPKTFAELITVALG